MFWFSLVKINKMNLKPKTIGKNAKKRYYIRA